MTRAIDLYELQETDTAIDAAERRLAEIVAELENEGDQTEQEAVLLELDAALRDAQRQQREAATETEDERSAIAELEEKLYSGTVKIARELKLLQDDVEAHKKQLAVLEDRALAAMTHAEQAESGLEEFKQERERVEQAHQEERLALQAERQELEKQIERLRPLRERHFARIDPPDRVLYERLRRARGGRAVAKVERGTCLGCRISLPTTVFQRARSGLKVVQCTSCERILYVV